MLDLLPLERRPRVVNHLSARVLGESGRADRGDLVPERPRVLWAVGPVQSRPRSRLRPETL